MLMSMLCEIQEARDIKRIFNPLNVRVDDPHITQMVEGGVLRTQEETPPLQPLAELHVGWWLTDGTFTEH
jgi:hypothetical protein